jgi:hypothetical protein
MPDSPREGREAAMFRRIAMAIGAVGLAAAVVIPTRAYAQSEVQIGPDAAAPVTMYVDNGNWLDVRVYVVRSGNIYDRIGTVRAFTTKEFELPRWVTSYNNYLQLVVAPIGSRERYAAPPVMVSAGDIVEWKLGSNLSNSNISVRAGWNNS